MNILPITAKLSPTRVRNLVYLAEIAALTRLATGFVRVNENKPSKLEKTTLNDNEKRLSLVERFFVEIIGTVGNLITLHLGQDLAARFLDKRLTIPQLSAEMIHLPAEKLKAANQAIKNVFGEQSEGLISRILYGKDVPGESGKTIAQKANLAVLREKLGDDLFNTVRPHVDDFIKKSNRFSSYAILVGVGISALFGGFGIQWLNDRVVSPIFTRYFKKKYGDMPSSTQFKHPLWVKHLTPQNAAESAVTFRQQHASYPQPPMARAANDVYTPNYYAGQTVPNQGQAGGQAS